MGSQITTFTLPPELPGEQWQPSNSTDGYSFTELFCSNCERDRDQYCDIFARSFCGEAVEWRHTEEKGCFCMAYVPLGEPLPEVPCPHTRALVFDTQKQGER